MKHTKIVLPEFMNDQGYLFGGYLLKWVDEFAYVTVSLDYPKNRFVTVALDSVVFKHAIECGQVLVFDVTETHMGKSSVKYAVNVYDGKQGDNSKILFSTNITFVNVTEDGVNAAIVK